MQDGLPGYEELSRMTDEQLTQLFGVRDPFVYEVDVAAIAGAASANVSFTIASDSNFLWQYSACFADIAAAVQTDSSRVLPLVTVTIQDGSSGRQLMNSAVPLPALFGFGSLPFLLPTPRFFRAQTTVNLSLTNYTAATTYGLRLSFIGTKFFRFANAQ